jgi:uncharacterized delta-60 repeat protein
MLAALDATRPTIRSLARAMVVLSAALIAILGPAAIARAAVPGSLDASFGSGGVANTGAGTRLLGTAVQNDGKIVAAGQTGGSALLLARFSASGGLDSSFGNHGLATGPATGAPYPGSIGRAVALQSDGKIVVVGSSGPSGGGGLLVERFGANGQPDGGFGHGGALNLLDGDFADGFAVAIQPDGKILAAGAADSLGSGGLQPRVLVVRLNSSGSLDSSFGSGGLDILDLGPESAARGVAVQPGGKIVLVGSTAPGLQVPVALVARLTSSGALDTSFAGTGYATHQFSLAGANSGFNAVAVQADGRVVAGGAAVAGAQGADAFVARFTGAGGLDSSFGTGGAVYESSAMNSPPGNSGVPGIRSIAIAPGGDIVGAGYAVSGPYSSAALWAFTSGGALDGRFGSHGMAVTAFGADRFDEFSALALAPNGDIAAVGDAQQSYQGAYTGIAARYGGFGPVTPVTPALNVSLKGVGGRYKTGDVATHGLKVGVSCNEACSIKVSLVLSAGTARKLHILSTFKKCTKVHGKLKCKNVRGYQAVTIAAGRSSLGGSATSTVTLKLVRSYVNALKRQKSFGASLQVSVISTVTHRSKTLSKGLTFTR